ncbi:MAG TPA: WG repeat-containing protein [Thermoanaerobaculia bacterium]|nr:WG repeat-containing protein [Thermoanaerobaculia bacterium]
MTARALALVIALVAPSVVAGVGAQEPGGAWRALDRQARELVEAGDYRAALPIARRSVDLAERELGPEHADLVPLLTRLADTLLLVGGAGEAEPVYRRALAIAETSPDPDEDQVGALLFDLASVLEDLGKRGEASVLYGRCADLFEPTLGADHPRVELCRSLAATARDGADADAPQEVGVDGPDDPAPRDAEVERWLQAMLDFYERAPFSASYRMTMSVRQASQGLDLAGEGTLIYGDARHLRVTAELAVRISGQAEPTALSVLVVGDGESVWTRSESPGREPQVTRVSVEEYEQASAGMGLGGVGAGDPLAQMRALRDLADLEVVERTAERVVLRGPFNDTFRERVGAAEQVFGAGAEVSMAIAPETGAPVAMSVGGEQLSVEMEFGNPVFYGPGSLPEGVFEYTPPEGLAPPHSADQTPADQTPADQALAEQTPAPASHRLSGYIDKTGAVVVEPIDSTYSDFAEGLANVEIAATDREGFIDRTGALVIEPRFSSAGSFSEGLARVKLPAGDYGYIDAAGAWVLEPRFSDAEAFSEGLALVGWFGEEQIERAWIDRTGEIVIGPRPYELAKSFSGGVAAFRQESLWGLIDRAGAVIVEPRFQRIRDAVEGFAAIQEDGLWGFVDVEGRVVIEPRYRAALDFGEGLAPVRLEDGWSYVDPSGEVVIQGPFGLAFPFTEGLGAVQIGARWGFIDRSGRVVIEPRFDQVAWFTEGLAAVEVDEKQGFVDRDGTVVIEPRFESVDPFSEGLARFTVTVPLSPLHGAVDAETSWVAAELRDLAYVAGRREDLESHLAFYRKLLSDYEVLVPPEPRFEELMGSLERLAGSVEVGIEVRRRGEIERDHFVEGRLELELSGSERAIDGFLERLPRLARLMGPAERTRSAPGVAIVETAVYWAPPPGIPQPRPCRRFSSELEPSSSRLERTAVETLESLCDELDAAAELRRLEASHDPTADRVRAIQDLVAEVQRSTRPELMEELDRQLEELLEEALRERPGPPPGSRQH